LLAFTGWVWAIGAVDGGDNELDPGRISARPRLPAAGSAPVPESAMLCWPPPALSVSVRLALRHAERRGCEPEGERARRAGCQTAGPAVGGDLVIASVSRRPAPDR